MQDLRQQLEDLRQEAKDEMQDADSQSEYYSKSGEHAAYKNMIKILEEREQEIEETLYSDEVKDMVETERPLPNDLTEGVESDE